MSSVVEAKCRRLMYEVARNDWRRGCSVVVGRSACDQECGTTGAIVQPNPGQGKDLNKIKSMYVSPVLPAGKHTDRLLR